MSWGVKITMLYAGFVLFIATMVSMSISQKVDLVSEDYYEQELQFQDKINLFDRTQALSNQLSWQVQNDKLTLDFPAQFRGKQTSGKVFFFRPSDAVLDKSMKIQADTLTTKSISIKTLKKGLYKIQINWEVENIQYYNEGFIQIK
jgi:nitrogen fixation protein FixH